MSKLQIIKLIISIALPLALGALAGLFTAQSIPEWFATLNKPSFNPPNWIFGPVWTTLYIIMGISFFLIWNQEMSKERNLAILVFMLQLVFNFGWSFIFFYFNMIGFALIEIILLWISIAFTLVLFYKIKPIASYINIPYLLWVTFATVLNGSFYFLNRG
ncbi:MAG: TspO protein [Flavobacteriales bacterium CG03_land_8_20_14_0_80_35_15]|nr:MAG: TspO protein [Flavobacteriales bacterium CG03_land_8_20_14_0_80_35_15]PIX07463.1 MAG: TspO protein [Flavobacteriales bacterium CG_4_8_14_3_um_filter_35_10]PJA05244.1 MAG: TspO protein [Flavobacteriales bacterium CG_4_10_14_0_2_um_filter_35_18]